MAHRETGYPSTPWETNRRRLSRVLVVEDHASELRLIVDLLTEEGFDVVACGNAAEALDHVQQEEIGVAVIDLRLPDLSGTQLLDVLLAKHQGIRVIIYTGFGSYESAKEALNLGAFAYVEKVGDPGELLRHVHRAVLTNMDAYALELEQVIHERDRAQDALARARQELELRVRTRTSDLDRANAALRRSDERFRQFADTVQDVFWMNKIEPFRFIFVNQAFERVWGLSTQALYENPRLWEECIHPDDRVRVQDTMQRWILAPPDALFDLDYRIVRPDGHLRWIHDRGVKIVEGDGHLCCLAGVAADITERKLAEQALREREQQLLQALEDRDTICQDLHDGALQSLYSVGLGLETCKSFLAEDPGQAREHLEHAITQLNGVMREVRYFIAGIRSDVLIALDLQTTVEKLVHRLARSSSTHFRVSIDPEAATRLRRAERMQLVYIVQEVVSNILRHARAQTGLLRLTNQLHGVQLSIQDDGIGFDSHQGGGDGHGLQNIAARVQRVGGECQVHSEPGKGTRITISFCGAQ